MTTLADYFCGGGGVTAGALQVPGVSVSMAANHWRLAVETHNLNHPDTDHDCADLSQVDPRRHPTTDIGWFSPECTNHGPSKGVAKIRQNPGLFPHPTDDQDAAERSRATMWDVIRFAEYHRYRYVIVENVVDVRSWVLWPAWSMALGCVGYEFRVVMVNSMFAGALGDPAAQSRDRGYVVAWRKGERPPDFDAWLRPAAFCPTHGTIQAVQAWKNPDRQVGKYRQQYVWRCPRVECRNMEVFPPVRPASDIIDWSLPAPRIGDRDKPLADKTMRRVEDGVAAYGRPLAVPVEGREGKKARPVDVPLRTCTTRNETGIAVPNLVAPYYSRTSLRPDSEPLPTVTTVDRHALLHGGVVRSVEDLGFRMLQPAEYAAAMAFPDDYQWLGSKRHRVRMAGNAVTTNVSRDLVGMVVSAMVGEVAPSWGLDMAA